MIVRKYCPRKKYLQLPNIQLRKCQEIRSKPHIRMNSHCKTLISKSQVTCHHGWLILKISLKIGKISKVNNKMQLSNLNTQVLKLLSKNLFVILVWGLLTFPQKLKITWWVCHLQENIWVSMMFLLCYFWHMILKWDVC